MKLIDALLQVDKSKSNTVDWLDLDPIKEALEISNYDRPDNVDTRIKGYWLLNWLCTDTWVGIEVIYFDDELVGYSEQTARKNGKHVIFVSNAAATKLRDYLLEGEQYSPDIIDEDATADSFYTVDFTGQLLTDTGFYNDRPATVVKDKHNQTSQKIKIKYTRPAIGLEPAQEIEEIIDVYDFKIPLHLAKQ